LTAAEQILASMKSYGRDRARLQSIFDVFVSGSTGGTGLLGESVMCGSVQAVQKTSPASGCFFEIKGVLNHCRDWHARCITS